MSIICIIFISAQLIGTTYATFSNLKGELDDIGVIDMLDVEVLQRHLIKLETLPSNKEWNADMNSDSKITITDLSLLVRKVEDRRDYTIELINVDTENYYIDRNQEIEIEFMADINYKDVAIRKMIINGKEYEVEIPNETRNTYSLKVNVGENEGIQEYKFTRAVLDTGTEVKLDHKFEVVVLKKCPEIKNYQLEENFEGTANITFDLVDEDNSIENAKFAVYKQNDKKEKGDKLTETYISAGNNKQEIPVEEGKDYLVEILVSYDTAPEKIEGKDHIDEELTYLKEFKSGLDYEFKITNIKTQKEGEEKHNFARNEEIQVSFNSTNKAYESTNSSNFEPSKVTINGKEYDVKKEDNKYIATIEGIEEIGEQTITIEKVKLGNGKEFTVEKDNSVKITIDETKAVLTNFEAQENIEEQNIKVKFQILDEEQTIHSARIELYDSGENIIERKEITLEEIANGTIEKILATKKTNKYIVKVIVAYEQTGAEETVLYKKEIPAIMTASIKDAQIDKTQISKGENVKITYEIETNSTSEIAKIRVNSGNYTVTKKAEGSYEITVVTSNTPNIFSLETTAIILEDETEIPVQNQLEVTILKDVPQVLEIKQEDNIVDNQVTVSYRLVNTDSSYISGKVQLVRADAKEGQPEDQELTVDETGHGRVTFENVEENVEYLARFTITYNRHPQEGQGEEETKMVAEAPIMLIRNYNLQVSNIKTANSKQESNYFKKNEEVIVSFTATNETKFVPEKAIINETEYELTKKEGNTNTYIAKLPGYDTYGKKEINIQTIILNNKRFLDVTNATKEIEVIKDKPAAKDFGYKEDAENENKVIASFDLKDTEETLIQGTITITDDHKKVLKTQKLVANRNEIIFDKTVSEYYTIKVIADYCLDSNKEGESQNKYQNQELLNEEINFVFRKVEMKDILDIALYKKDGETVTELSTVNITELENKEQFIVNVQMKDMPSFYAPIKRHYIEEGELKFELEYENIIQYKDGIKQEKLEVTYGTVKGTTATNNSFASLIMQMRKILELKKDPKIWELLKYNSYWVMLQDLMETLDHW